MNLNKIGKLFTSKSVGTGPASYKKKRIYRAVVSQRLRNTDLLYLNNRYQAINQMTERFYKHLNKLNINLLLSSAPWGKLLAYF